MSIVPEQFSEATKAAAEANIALLTSSCAKLFEGTEKIIGLNISAAKASFEESNAAVKQLLSIKDPQEWFSVTAAYMQPNAEKALAYSRHLAGIFSGMQAEFTKATETQVTESSRKVLALVEELSKNAPAGSENAFSMIKTAIGNAGAGYEQLSKTTKQAVETIEANVTNAVSTFTQPVDAKAAAARAKK
jgi:phasin family protein